MESLPEDGFIRMPRFMGVMSNASGLSIRALRMGLPATFSVGDDSHRRWCAFRSPANMNGWVVDKKSGCLLESNPLRGSKQKNSRLLLCW